MKTEEKILYFRAKQSESYDEIVRDPDGTWYGWGHVLDYIGVEWREPWRQFEKQESLFDREVK